MPLFLLGNSAAQQFPYFCAYVAKEYGRKGSNVYEMNQWLWRSGKGKPRLGGLSVSETEELRIAALLGVVIP